ncbi:hypothetical protein Prudu_015022, partial [Prunus dulcis]
HPISLTVEKYLEEVKVAAARGGGGIGIIKPDALVLGEIIKYWKAMLEDIKQQQKQGLGNFKNCLAVCCLTDILGNGRAWAMSLGLVVSELSEELVWKGKVITFGDSQHELLLHSIQGDDLKSKAKFMMRTNKDFSIANFPEACDLILKVAVNENLKPEQMVKKVFVFTDFSCRGIDWKPSYEAVRSKFKEQGYGDEAIPKVLIWEPHPGLKILSGYSDNLGKVFLDNGGEIGPHQLMEAAIADKEYQALSVLASNIFCSGSETNGEHANSPWTYAINIMSMKATNLKAHRWAPTLKAYASKKLVHFYTQSGGELGSEEMGSSYEVARNAKGVSLQELRDRLAEFAQVRGWDQYHSPRNLLLALVGEVGELSEIFQWKGEVARGLPNWTCDEKEHLEEELSDVLLYLIQLADVCGLDLGKAALSKIVKNARKYPVTNQTPNSTN